MSVNINNTKRDFKGVWIPKKIWLNKHLTLIEKCLLVEINSLDNDDGCYASNEYLADFLNTSIPTISRSIAKMKTIGYLYQKSFDGRHRSLSVNEKKLPNQNDKADDQNDEAAAPKRSGGHINLSKSSISNNTINNIDNIHAEVPRINSDTIIQKYGMKDIVPLSATDDRPASPDMAADYMSLASEQMTTLYVGAGQRDKAIKFFTEKSIPRYKTIYQCLVKSNGNFIFALRTLAEQRIKSMKVAANG